MIDPLAISQQYADGLTLREIAVASGVSRMTISRLLDKNRIARRTKKELYALIKKKTKGIVNKGKRLSPATEFKPGYKLSPESEARRRANISKAQKGRVGISPSQSTRDRLSLALRGEKSHLWKGGVTPEVNKRIRDRHWRKISKEIRGRDNNSCQCCGGKGNIVHHKIPYLISQDNTPGNLETLCYRCHAITEHGIRKNGGMTW